MKKRIGIPACIACFLLAACSTTKHVPDGHFLLKRAGVSIDAKNVRAIDLEGHIRQKGNGSSLRLRLYNAGDTTGWFKRLIRKSGEAPVIYSAQSVPLSVKALRIEMENRGYLNVEVSARTDTVGEKAVEVKYIVAGHEPYRIRSYAIDIFGEDAPAGPDSLFLQGMKRLSMHSKIKPGVIFDATLLEEERQKINRIFHNSGYYGLASDNLYFMADTALQSCQADLTLTLRDTANFHPYTVRRVNVFSGYDPMTGRQFTPEDSTVYHDLNIFYSRPHFIRPHVLQDNISISPGQKYSERLSEETYDLISSLSAVSRTGIEYREADADALDCNIYLTPGNIHGIQMGLEGTNNAGDLGIAGNISYTHNNIFNGSEMLNVKLKGAYEFINGVSDANLLTKDYYEAGIGASLTFPKIIFPFLGHKIKKLFRANTQFGLSLDMQSRPEYTREFFNAFWKYKWENLRGRVQHSLNLMDVNFVAMPYKSAKFDAYINSASNYLTKRSYDNVFTAGIGYSGSYAGAPGARYRNSLYAMRYGVELSGNLLSGIYRLVHAPTGANGQYQLLGNPFAQYVKADFDYSRTYRLNEKNAIALHGGFGIACPYGNSTILPFEKRYYGGGPNSVRGWSTRRLGPGTYDAGDDFSIRTGDLKILLNAEYRYKLVPLLELAGFVDAGNVWTIRDYPNQPGGQFRIHSFYEELAVAAGIGLRLDLTFLIIRIDAGKKLYDPALKDANPWVIADKMKGNSAVHFAIGYPF
jgi:outer membrane protein assembly factor BamA